MKRLSIALLAAAVALPGSALAQDFLTPYGTGYFGDEPTVAVPGTLPYANHNTDRAVTTYPADNTGAFDAAKAGTASEVLAARFYSGVNVIGINFWGLDTRADGNRFLGAFTGSNYLYGVGHFLAWHGTWADLNKDGWLTTGTTQDSRLAIDLASGRDCGDAVGRLRTDDPDGLGANQGANTGVSWRCTSSANEWSPAAKTRVVGYVTPHVPTESFPSNTLFDEQTRGPDFEMTTFSPGNYTSPATNWDLVFVDNSLLETTAVEIIASPVTSPDGPRSEIIGTGSNWDVDVYQSIDPFVEGLYQTALAAYVAEDCDTDHPENAVGNNDCPKSVSGLLPPLPSPDYRQTTDPKVGPETSKRFTPVAQETVGRPDYVGGPHVYLDARLALSGYVATAATAIDFPMLGPGAAWSDASSYGGFSNSGSGSAEAPVYAGVYGFLGVWYDRNGDGWVGKLQTNPACPGDPYRCGSDPDPNDWSDVDESTGEWTPACLGGRRNGEMFGRLESSTGSWGRGVYLLTDRYYAGVSEIDPDFDNYEFDNRVAFNPYDDAVADLYDGSVDHLVLSGPIDFHIVCWNPVGQIKSFEHFVFLPSETRFDVIVSTVPEDFDFRSAGVDEIETVSDTDVYPAWVV